MPLVHDASCAIKPGWAPARRRRVVLAICVLAGLGLMLPGTPAYALTDGGYYLQTWNAASADQTWLAPPGAHWGGPAISSYSGGVDLADTATNGSLWDMSYDNATGLWTTTVITGTAAVSSDPAIMHADGGTDIAVVAPDGSLRLFWAFDGSTSWHNEYVGGPVAAVAPAITDSGTATEIAAAAPDGSLWYYWAYDGTATWNPEQVAGAGSSVAAPAIAM